MEMLLIKNCSLFLYTFLQWSDLAMQNIEIYSSLQNFMSYP